MLAEEAAMTSGKALNMHLRWDIFELIQNYPLKLDEIRDGPRGCDAGQKRHLLQSQCLILLAKNLYTIQHTYSGNCLEFEIKV